MQQPISFGSRNFSYHTADAEAVVMATAGRFEQAIAAVNWSAAGARRIGSVDCSSPRNVHTAVRIGNVGSS